jgi:hypothetical protein
MSKLTRVTTAALAVVMVVGVASCSNDDKKVASCDSVTTQLSKLDDTIKQDQTKVANLSAKDKGTPSEVTAKNQLSSDQDKRTTLVTSQEKLCGKPSPSPSPSATALSATKVVDQLKELCPGCNVGTPKSSLLAGSQVKTDAKHHTPVRGVNSFSKKTLTTPKEVGEFLNLYRTAKGAANNDLVVKSRQAHDRVVAAIKAAGYGQSEIDRALNGDGYFAVQMVLPSQIKGTSYSVGGKTYVAADWRTVPAGDILWLFMTTDYKIIKGAAVRADCGNPNVIVIRPITPKTPPKPPVNCADVNAPGCKPVKCIFGVYNPTTGLCSKDPKADPQSQGNVPTQVVENQPSVDNPTEASSSPMPTYNSGNGIPPSATPRATPSPAPTHSGPTTVPAPSSSPTTDPTVQASPTATGGVPTHPPGG